MLLRMLFQIPFLCEFFISQLTLVGFNSFVHAHMVEEVPDLGVILLAAAVATDVQRPGLIGLLIMDKTQTCIVIKNVMMVYLAIVLAGV